METQYLEVETWHSKFEPAVKFITWLKIILLLSWNIFNDSSYTVAILHGHSSKSVSCNINSVFAVIHALLNSKCKWILYLWSIHEKQCSCDFLTGIIIIIPCVLNYLWVPPWERGAQTMSNTWRIECHTKLQKTPAITVLGMEPIYIGTPMHELREAEELCVCCQWRLQITWAGSIPAPCGHQCVNKPEY